MNRFELTAPYLPTGDQPQAIQELTEGIRNNERYQVLLGATGTGKTFTIANVIQNVQKPTLVFVHNKTLAGQLYSEFKELFPKNRVEYFVSNFDYYQPEAYMPKTDTYIEKTAMVNEELDMLRMAALNAVLTRPDTIIVSPVASIYASSDPDLYRDMFFTIHVNEHFTRTDLLRKLVERQYKRNDMDRKRGTYRVRGDVIDITMGFTEEFFVRVEMFDDVIERITEVDPVNNKTINSFTVYNIYPADEYARPLEDIRRACDNIEEELEERLVWFKDQGKLLEAERLEQRTRYDLESLREFGICSGVENYSRHIDFRAPGQRPYNLYDYFPKDFLLVIDESHMSVPQIRGMYNGDRARKEVLVEYGFRLPSALDNRPMRFEEWESLVNQVIFVSATPGDYELEKTEQKTVQQIIRPTGLLDPKITIKPSEGQIDDLIDQIQMRAKLNERVLITTLTVKMAEELTAYLKKMNLKVVYLHHETKTLERTEIIRDLRLGKYDVLVGINLLREGLDIPEVSLVAILDADKEGLFRSTRSLIQTIGRAARNEHGEVILYADTMTQSMQQAIDETNRRRAIQEAYNEEHGITPHTVIKEVREAIHGKETKEMTSNYLKKRARKDQKEEARIIASLEKEMKEAAKALDFERAAELRDIIMELRG